MGHTQNCNIGINKKRVRRDLFVQTSTKMLNVSVMSLCIKGLISIDCNKHMSVKIFVVR